MKWKKREGRSLRAENACQKAMRTVQTLGVRHCEYCKAEYTPRVSRQRFCPTSDCRRRWWKQHWRSGAVHKCGACGLEHGSSEAGVLIVGL